MIYLIEFKNAKGWLSKFFDVFGKNALFVFALSAFLPKGLALIKLGDGVNPWKLALQKGSHSYSRRTGKWFSCLCTLRYYFHVVHLLVDG
jgi:predicted acyltransferase